jgi:hypothetical protein
MLPNEPGDGRLTSMLSNPPGSCGPNPLEEVNGE